MNVVDEHRVELDDCPHCLCTPLWLNAAERDVHVAGCFAIEQGIVQERERERTRRAARAKARRAEKAKAKEESA